MPGAGKQGVDGALAGTAAPVGSMAMSDSDKGAPWRPGLGARRRACCSPALQEYRILLVSQEGRRHRWLQGRVGMDTAAQSEGLNLENLYLV